MIAKPGKPTRFYLGSNNRKSMSTAELRKRVIARVKLSKDAMLLRELDRMLKDAGKELAPFITTPEQKKAIARSRAAVKRGRVRTAAEAEYAFLHQARGRGSFTARKGPPSGPFS